MKINIALYIVLSIMCFGCAKESINSNSGFSKIIDVSSESQRSLSDELGLYTEQFKHHNGNINIHSTTRTNLLGEPSYSGRITAWYIDDLETVPLTTSYGGDFYINDLHIGYNNDTYYSNQYVSNNQVDFDFINNFINTDVLGKTIRIRNETNNEVKFNEQIYVPEQIHISGDIKKKIEGTIFTRMNRDNFTFSYNYDEKNENGLLIQVVSSGEFYGMSLDDIQNLATDNSKNITRAVQVKPENSGMVTIPATLFEGIPSEGIFTMYIGRGNGKLIQKDGKEYFLRTHTTQQFRVVLD